MPEEDHPPLPEGWFYPDVEEAGSLLAELQRELPPGHLLHGVPVITHAMRQGTDDVLFRHRDKPERFTVIHLSWLGRTEINTLHPSVEFDGTFAGFLAEEARIFAVLEEEATDDSTYREQVWIGCSADDPRLAMHSGGIRFVHFSVRFEPLSGPRETRNYCRSLDSLWSPFLLESGLSAWISHSSWQPVTGVGAGVIGTVWRQKGTERFESITAQEIQRLVEILRAATPVIGFNVREGVSTARHGDNVFGRRFRLDNGVFSEEAPQEEKPNP